MLSAQKIILGLLLFVTLVVVPIPARAATDTILPVVPETPAGGTTATIPATATTPTPDPSIPSNTNWDAANQATFTGNNIVNMLSCLGTGFPLGGKGCPQTVFELNKITNRIEPATKITFNGEGGGALAGGGQLLALIYKSPPASGVEYIASAIRSGFGLTTPAYAQVGGSGAGVIAPVKAIWQVMRNIAYLAFIVVFVVAGLMIMFRQKISQQAVIGIQQALPGLVVGLILVTFSYFIVGLLVDLAFLGSQVIGILFVSQFGNPNSLAAVNKTSGQAVNDLLNNHNVISLFSNLALSGNLFSAAGAIGDQTGQLLYSIPWGRALFGVIGALLACLNPISLGLMATGIGIPPVLAACVAAGGVGGGGLVGTVISAIVYLVLLFGLLQAMFRLLFSLIGAYVSIVVSTVFGPFIILFSSFPGKGGSLQGWINSLLANILVFPAVFGAFLLIATILNFGDPWYLDNNAVGKFEQTLPLFGGGSSDFIKGLLAYGLLLATPGIPDFIKEQLKVSDSRAISGAIKQGTAGGTGMLTQTIGSIAKALPKKP